MLVVAVGFWLPVHYMMITKELPLIDIFIWSPWAGASLSYMNTTAMRISDEGNKSFLLWAVDDAPYVVTCYFEGYSKVIYPDRNFFCASEEGNMMDITVDLCWWSPFRGYWLFDTQSFWWEDSFVIFRLK